MNVRTITPSQASVRGTPISMATKMRDDRNTPTPAIMAPPTENQAPATVRTLAIRKAPGQENSVSIKDGMDSRYRISQPTPIPQIGQGLVNEAFAQTSKISNNHKENYELTSTLELYLILNIVIHIKPHYIIKTYF